MGAARIYASLCLPTLPIHSRQTGRRLGLPTRSYQTPDVTHRPLGKRVLVSGGLLLSTHRHSAAWTSRLGIAWELLLAFPMASVLPFSHCRSRHPAPTSVRLTLVPHMFTSQ